MTGGGRRQAHDLVCEMARYYRVTPADMYGRSRRQPVVEARQHAMAVVYEHTDLSLKETGRLFGDRDHSTVVHGIAAVKKRFDGRVPVPDMLEQKYCSGCCKVKVRAEFSRNLRPEGDGRQSLCKPCASEERRRSAGVRSRYRTGRDWTQVASVLDTRVVEALRETAREWGELQSEIVERAVRRELVRIWETCRECRERKAMGGAVVCGPCFSEETKRKAVA